MKVPGLDRIGRRNWSDEDVAKYVGPYRDTYLSHATDAELRRWSSSGGSTTAILLHLLDSGQIDGAMVVRGWVDGDGEVHADFEIATSRAELIAAQGSKYQAVRFGKRELTMIAEFDGRLGLVLLPCDATKLAGARQRRPEIDAKVALVIALYCGHNSEPELVHHVTEKISEGRGKLTDFHYRSGHWRGQMTATFEDGSAIQRPFTDFSNVRNLYFFSQEKCNHCSDHFGYDCDLSVGDIWTLAMRREPIKHTTIITRTARGVAAVEAATEADVIHREPTVISDILDGQSRTLPFHYNVSARSAVGRLFGLNIPDRVGERVRLRDRLVAFLLLLDQRLSRSKLGARIIMRLPKPVLRGYLIAVKALEQL
jgi:coenzyme F420 hydrogenase subunit beta